MARYSSDLACDWPYEGIVSAQILPSSHEEKGSGVTTPNPFASNMKRPIKLQSGIHWEMRKQEQVLQSPCSKWYYEIPYPTLQFVTCSASPKIQACDTTPFSHQRAQFGHETSVRCVMYGWMNRIFLSSDVWKLQLELFIIMYLCQTTMRYCTHKGLINMIALKWDWWYNVSREDTLCTDSSYY